MNERHSCVCVCVCVWLEEISYQVDIRLPDTKPDYNSRIVRNVLYYVVTYEYIDVCFENTFVCNTMYM